MKELYLSFSGIVGLAGQPAPLFAADGDAMQSYAKARDNFMTGMKPMFGYQDKS